MIMCNVYYLYYLLSFNKYNLCPTLILCVNAQLLCRDSVNVHFLCRDIFTQCDDYYLYTTIILLHTSNTNYIMHESCDDTYITWVHGTLASP